MQPRLQRKSAVNQLRTNSLHLFRKLGNLEPNLRENVPYVTSRCLVLHLRAHGGLLELPDDATSLLPEISLAAIGET
jgi:hypothetical protein